MVFSSLTFLWIFLPVTLLVYFISRERFRNIILLAASMFFYAWGEPFYVLIMLASILFNFFSGFGIANKNKTRSKFFLTLGIIGNLSLLSYYKYADFFVANLNAVLPLNLPSPEVVLPIGISFYTFQSISYLVDIYRKEVSPQKNVVKMGLYIALFPPLIAGPIVKYHDINRQIDSRSVTLNKFNMGVGLFIIGLTKKVLIANVAAKTADTVFALNMAQYGTVSAWIGILAYTLQIYFDFSGYSDMAIGLSKMFGFDIKQNFNYPYISQSIKEFWRRWHISLSTWFKEYLYIPLGGNRRGAVRTYVNLLIVFFATGLWHGASWNFVVWGMYHGLFLVLERLLPIEKKLRFGFIRNFYAVFVVVVGWVFFRAENLTQAVLYLKKMFLFEKGTEGMLYLTNELLLTFIIGFIACGFIQKFHSYVLKNRVYRRFFSLLRPVFLSVFLFICILYLSNNTYNPFIYFRF
ncbi:alginate O-acetyltransferase complex protein AlgI [Elusimicrobium posterum]|uniref:MBOAT family O-acyltransferase n=1 Tax=Elusimicrobium posterum TaxID=3116653 RepID=UPI003C733A83